MSHKQNVEENLKRFADGIGLDELKLNEHNACGLCFDESLIVNMEFLEDDESLVFVSSAIKVDAHLQDNEKTNLLEKTLFINLQHHNMSGAYLALNHDKSEILLIRSMSAGIDYGTFESSLEKFVNSLEWTVAELNNEGENLVDNEAASNNAAPPQSTPNKPSNDMGMMV